MNHATAALTAKERESPPYTAWELPATIPALRRPAPTPRRKPTILPHYPAVVEFVYENRVAVPWQLRRRFPQMHKRRTADYQLESLRHLGLLNIVPLRAAPREWPNVYLATPPGVRFVSDTYAAAGIAWDGKADEARYARGRSLPDIQHELMLTEFSLNLWQTIETRPDLRLLTTIERRFHRPDKQLAFSHGDHTEHVRPDAGFLLSADRPGSTPSVHLYFVELDNGTTPITSSADKRSVADKLAAYGHWARSEEGERALAALYRRYNIMPKQPSFRLLIIANDRYQFAGGGARRLAQILTVALDLPRAMRDRIWLTEAEQLKRHQYDLAPLAAPTWVLARPAWLADYRQLQARLPRGTGHNPLKRQYDYVADRVATVPRRSLISPATQPAPQPAASVGQPVANV